jgi:hypothetical protein
MNMNTLITNFENKVNALVIAENGVAHAENDVELAIIDIVSLLQKDKGYVEFTAETSYPYFDDDTIGMDAIIAIKVEDGLLKLLTESQMEKPDDEDVEWFNWKYYGELNFKDLGYILKMMSKKP